MEIAGVRTEIRPGGSGTTRPDYTWCQSCGLRYALALPKRPRLCNRCGGSNPEDEGGAPDREARQERTDHRYFGVPAGRPQDPITGDPFRRLRNWHARRSAPH